MNGSPTGGFAGDEQNEAEACAAALRAAFCAQAHISALKLAGDERAQAINFGIGVHFGDVVFGNAGTPERLKFGVIGRAVNEVARAEDMSKALKHPVIVTDAVASRVAALDGQAGTLTNLGLHDLRGIPTARRLWALPLG